MMNIKITAPIPDHLIEVIIPFGSRVYGTHNDCSDHDELNIVKFNTGDFPLQYTSREDQTYKARLLVKKLGNDVDYIYTDFRNFFDKAKSGANTIFFECIHTAEFKLWMEKSQVEPFNPLEGYDLYNSRVAKAYLGLAKRDLEFGLDRIHHVNRCVWMAEKIIKKELINLSDVAKIEMSMDVDTLKQKIKKMREGLVYA